RPFLMRAAERRVVAFGPRERDLHLDRLALPAAFAERIEHALPRIRRSADRDQPVGPAADPARGLGRERGAEDLRRTFGTRVKLRLLDAHSAAMRHGLAGPERTDDLDGLEKTRVALALLRPVRADDVLVQRLAAADREPEPVGIHL